MPSLEWHRGSRTTTEGGMAKVDAGPGKRFAFASMFRGRSRWWVATLALCAAAWPLAANALLPVHDIFFGTEGLARIGENLGPEDKPFAMTRQADGKVVVAGASSSDSRRGVVLRYLPDGKPDPAFGNAGVVELDDNIVPGIGSSIVTGGVAY